MYENRKLVIAALMIMLGLTIISRLLYVQILTDRYREEAEMNSRRKVIQYPSRGLISDRKGKLLVSNQPVYDLMIVGREVERFDSVDFCNTVGIDMPTLRGLFAEHRRQVRNHKASNYKPAIFLRQLSVDQYAALQERLYRLPGFYAQRRTLRKYEYPVAANVLGPILTRFAKEIAPLVVPGGKLILSGILDTETDPVYREVKAAYEALGFRELSSKLIGEWRTGLFTR